LEANNISTRRMFGGNLARQPAFKSLPHATVAFDGADYVMERTFWLGCHPSMSLDMVHYIVDVFAEWFKNYD